MVSAGKVDDHRRARLGHLGLHFVSQHGARKEPQHQHGTAKHRILLPSQKINCWEKINWLSWLPNCWVQLRLSWLRWLSWLSWLSWFCWFCWLSLSLYCYAAYCGTGVQAWFLTCGTWRIMDYEVRLGNLVGYWCLAHATTNKHSYNR